MSNIGVRVRETREARGLSLAELGQRAGNLAYQTIQDLESGKSRGSKHLLAIARALGVYPEWLENGTGPRDAEINLSTGMKGKQRTEPSQSPILSEDKLKVLGMAECGPDGWATWDGEIVDWVPRPANLAGARDAYAVFIMGDSMVPRYHPGEIAFLNPARPVTPGAYVLVQKKPKTAGESPLAIIKKLVKRSGDKVILEQHNPPKTITLALADIVSMHRVVGSVEA